MTTTRTVGVLPYRSYVRWIRDGVPRKWHIIQIGTTPFCPVYFSPEDGRYQAQYWDGILQPPPVVPRSALCGACARLAEEVGR